MLTGIGGIAVIGWVAEVARRVANGEEDTLPEWEKIGDFFMIGLKYMGISLIWASPIILPIILVSIIMAGGTMISDDPGPLIAALGIVNVCIAMLAMIFGLAISLLVPPLWVLLAEGESFKKLINPKHAWELFKANAGGYIVAMLITWLASTVLAMVGTLVCGIGVLPAGVISQLIMGHLTGQATAQARENIANLPKVPDTQKVDQEEAQTEDQED
jgi:hypothetical protein